MNIVPQETSLVIAGAWNPAILTPPWVMSHAMDGQDPNAQMVQAFFPAGLNGAFEMPRFAMPGFQYSARVDSLILLPSATSEEFCALVEGVARRALGQLSHTPIGGLGYNFEFRDGAPAAEWLAAFANSQLDLVDASGGLDVTRTTLATSFSAGASQMNVQRYVEGHELVVKFNFHHPAHDARSALEVLGEQGQGRFWAHFLTASRIVSRLYPEGEAADD